jgi:hypothetical protein
MGVEGSTASALRVEADGVKVTNHLTVTNTGSYGPPTFGTRSAGAKLVLYPDLTATTADYALGVEGGTLWFGTPGPATNFVWYNGTTPVYRILGGTTPVSHHQIGRTWMGDTTAFLGMATDSAYRLTLQAAPISYGFGLVGFYHQTAKVGSITTDAQYTSYNTSSDYRLKDNVEPMEEGATDRLLRLRPCTFSFKRDPAQKRLEGFLAHEAQEVVPQAVTGTKDAVDEATGEILPQGIDLSKLVPLLTAALQESVRTVRELERRLARLEKAR